MDKTRFTEGTWRVGFNRPYNYEKIPLADGASITSGLTVVVRGGQGEQGAQIGIVGETETKKYYNAHLVSAAPDIYAALEAIIEKEQTAPLTHALWERGVQALVKARG